VSFVFASFSNNFFSSAFFCSIEIQLKFGADYWLINTQSMGSKNARMTRSQLRLHQTESKSESPAIEFCFQSFSFEWQNSPHGLHGNWLEDVLAAANTHAEASARCENKRKREELGQLTHLSGLIVTHPSPSSLIAVSASTRSTKPTVVFSLQSMPNRHDSSISFEELRLQLLPTFDSVSHWLSSTMGHWAVQSSSLDSLSHAVALALKREPPLLVASLK
jgi:hypothetical protein